MFGCKKILRALLRSLVMAMCVLCVSCSGAGEEKAADGAVYRMTDEVAGGVVEKIKTPVDAARMTKDLAEARLGEIDKGVAAEK